MCPVSPVPWYGGDWDCCISPALENRRKTVGWMIEKDIPFGDGEGMHIARIESPAAGYALYLLRLGIQEDEDSMDDWGKTKLLVMAKDNI
jgi:hypothetical protein